MRLLHLLISLSWLLEGCNNTSRDEINRLSGKIDSLQAMLEKQQVHKAGKADTTEQNPLITEKKNDPVGDKRQPQIIKIDSAKSVIAAQPSEEIFFYNHSPKTISLRITPWKNNERTLQFYDNKGKETYIIVDERKSYYLITHVKYFHANGAVAEINIHNNPGASMYWYETSITFGTDNVPLWRTDTQHPETSPAQQLNNKSYWNKETRTWVKQEIVREQNVPVK